MKKKIWSVLIVIGIIILVAIWIIGIKLFKTAGEAFDEAFVIQPEEMRNRG